MSGRATSALVPRDGASWLRVSATGPDLDVAWERAREAMSREAVQALGEREGFRIEDLRELDVAAPDPAHAARWLARRAPSECVVRAGPEAATVRIDALVARRGESGLTQRQRYARDGAEGRIRVEALEFHLAEHCNLRCAHCCNMSPYLAERFLSLDEVERLAAITARTFDCDVFKIMGGEPLLHPDITAVLEILRRARVSPIVRLFTNGLLLSKMDDAFWRALDQLTVSVYASAPVKPALLDDVREKARRFDVVLNVKRVDSFSRVLRAEREDDDAAVRATHAACWLRHRCMILRDGHFYTCTHAAYFREFGERILHDPAPAPPGLDAVPLDAPDFGEAVLAYLNRGEPLAACRYCHGGDGPTLPHAQLRKKDVIAGRLEETPEPS